MSVTLAVFQPETSSVSRLWHWRNIKKQFVISLVFTLLKSMLVQLLKKANSSEQSPVKLTSLVAVTLVTADGVTSLPQLSKLLYSPQLSERTPVVLSKE